jgi:hypothetical protein
LGLASPWEVLVLAATSEERDVRSQQARRLERMKIERVRYFGPDFNMTGEIEPPETVTHGRVWVATSTELVRIKPDTIAIIAKVALGLYPVAITYLLRSIETNDSLLEIDPLSKCSQ